MIKNHFFPALLFLYCITTPLGATAQDVFLDWVRTMGGEYMDQGNGITVDPSGNVYTIGYFRETADFNIGSGATNLSSWGGTDVYVSKHDENGTLAWAKRYGAAGDDIGNAIASDAAGNIYITGSFAREMNFGTVLLRSNGGDDIFIAKLNSSGNCLWAKSIGNKNDQTATAIALDAAGNNLYVVGTLGKGQVNMDPGNTPQVLEGDGMFALKLSGNNGAFVWAKRVGFGQGRISLGESLNAIAVSSGDFLHIAGQFQGTVDFDPAGGNQTLTAQSTEGNDFEDAFILKLSNAGNFVWVKALTGTGRIYASDIITDSQGDVIYTGSFAGTADFDPGPGAELLSTPAIYSFASYIAKLNAQGNFLWAKQLGQNWCRSFGIAIDKNNDIFTTGGYLGKVDFNPSTAAADTFFLESSDKSNSNAYTMKLTGSGDFLWVKKVSAGLSGYVGSNRGYKVLVDNKSSVYTVGSFQGRVDFDPGAGTSVMTHQGHNSDIFVHKMACSSSVQNVTVARCGSYFWHGTTYTQSGTYYHTENPPVGCPVTTALHLTIHPIEKPNITVDHFTLGTSQPYQYYQWYLNDSLISGATGPTHLVIKNGWYKVAVETNKGCKDVSEPYQVTNVTEPPPSGPIN